MVIIGIIVWGIVSHQDPITQCQRRCRRRSICKKRYVIHFQTKMMNVKISVDLAMTRKSGINRRYTMRVLKLPTIMLQSTNYSQANYYPKQGTIIPEEMPWAMLFNHQTWCCLIVISINYPSTIGASHTTRTPPLAHYNDLQYWLKRGRTSRNKSILTLNLIVIHSVSLSIFEASAILSHSASNFEFRRNIPKANHSGLIILLPLHRISPTKPTNCQHISYLISTFATQNSI